MTIDAASMPEAGPSTLTPGPTPYHETSQFRHWRYSVSQLDAMRAELNSKSVDVFKRNSELEKAAQKEMGHDFQPPPLATYLSVEDELLLLHFYIIQVSAVCRKGFGLPEVVESTAITYLKRFYLKNSVMEWHPKTIMPTCLFLAAKTTNFPVPLDVFTPKFKGLTEQDILDTEFLLAQSLSFEFWTRGAEKAFRGWGLEFQSVQGIATDRIQQALPKALEYLSASRRTDLEFTHSPSQISLAAWYLADQDLVMKYLEGKYGDSERMDDAEEPFGTPKDRIEEILEQLADIVKAAQGDLDLKKVKEVDKRLKGCTNPEKVPGTALYIKRKQESERVAEQARVAKLKAKPEEDNPFGGALRVPLSPRVTVPSPSGRPA